MSLNGTMDTQNESTSNQMNSTSKLTRRELLRLGAFTASGT